MPEHPGDDFEIERIGTRCHDERAKLLDFARLDLPRLVAKRVQFRIIIPDFTHSAPPITGINRCSVSANRAPDNCAIPEAKQVTPKLAKTVLSARLYVVANAA